MDYLGVEKAHVMGISMGGMIAQELAINHPDKAKLVLACTYAAQDENSGDTEEVAGLWRQKATPKRFLSARQAYPLITALQVLHGAPCKNPYTIPRI